MFVLPRRPIRPIWGDPGLSQNLPEDWDAHYPTLSPEAAELYAKVYYYYATHPGIPQPSVTALMRDALFCNTRGLTQRNLELVEHGLITYWPKRASQRVRVHSPASVQSHTCCECSHCVARVQPESSQPVCHVPIKSIGSVISSLREEIIAPNQVSHGQVEASASAGDWESEDVETEPDYLPSRTSRTAKRRPKGTEAGSRSGSGSGGREAAREALRGVSASGHSYQRPSSPKVADAAKREAKRKQRQKTVAQGILRDFEGHSVLAYWGLQYRLRFNQIYSNYDYATVVGQLNQLVRRHGVPALRAYIDVLFERFHAVDHWYLTQNGFVIGALSVMIPTIQSRYGALLGKYYWQQRQPARYGIELPEAYRGPGGPNVFIPCRYYDDDPQGERLYGHLDPNPTVG